MSDASRQKATLFVGGLDNAVTKEVLHDAFIPFGEIVEIQLPKPDLPSSPEPHRGFGYVEFSLVEDAREAIDNMDQAELFGRVIKVNIAKPRKSESEGLGSKTAVWEQEDYAARYNVSNEEADIATQGRDGEQDSMQSLEGLAVAGPQLR